ncbi:glycine receptor subunit alpha-2-like [Mercenaria mercenaria]|uniref:glycine receptor subunit alpha-2-like n=1 Tax=Mercenaria mercenaria TaxID=6596 RepID=UPI00234E3B60|nr:glycine receptor subunit alpha-2-like [Mercenaria mercenaria]
MHHGMIVIPVFVLLLIRGIAGGTDDANMATVLREMFDGYDKTLPPKYDRVGFDKQVTVKINIFVHSMFSLSEAKMEYSMSMFMRERWVDERLKYNNTVNISRVELDKFYFESVWMPDMYILSEKESSYHEVTVPNKMLHIYPDGTVQYSAKVTGIFSCLMFLEMYPFDTQTCALELESYGHSTETMKFVWNENAITASPDIKFPQFEVKNYSHYNCDRDYYGIFYPCIGVSFILERQYTYHIIQIYIPSILTVILSWVNFWLDCTAVPARITLGLLTVLTMTTQSSAARANLPQVSYIKAIDYYMAVCLTFVFLGLLEFAFVNVLTRADSKQDKNQTNREEMQSNNSTHQCKCEIKSVSSTFQPYEKPTPGNLDTKRSTKSGFIPFLTSVSKRGSIGPRTVDKFSRVVFPLSFMLFNLFYWSYYFLVEHNLPGSHS